MNVWKEILYSIIRSLISSIAGVIFGWLVSHGIITEGQAALATLSLVAFVSALVWSLWQKVKSKYKLDAALSLDPILATNEDVHAVAKNATFTEIVSQALAKGN